MRSTSESTFQDEYQEACTLRSTILKDTPEPGILGSGKEFTKLHYPSVNSVQASRFDVSEEGWFEYQGRISFSELLAHSKEILTPKKRKVVYLRGSMGSGKSHILAAVVCSLFKEHYRPIFISDCRAFVKNPLLQLKSAMILTFSDDEDTCRRIYKCRDKDQLLLCMADLTCRYKHKIIFLFDQINALDEDDTSHGTEKEKEPAKELFNLITGVLPLIKAASANHFYAINSKSANTGEILMDLYGGMELQEYSAWVTKYKTRLPPDFDEEAQFHYYDISGAVPLYMKHVMDIEKGYWDGLESVLKQEPFKTITNEIPEWVLQQLSRTADKLVERKMFMETMDACILGLQTVEYRQYIDPRFFYYLDGVGKCVNGYVRETVLRCLRKHQPYTHSSFLTTTWFSAIDDVAANPSMLGFLFECMVIDHLVTKGLTIQTSNIYMNELKRYDFSGDYPAIDLEADAAIYIPTKYNYKDVDAIIIRRKKADSEATVVITGVQVTLSTTHKMSHRTFFSKWSRWQKLASVGGAKVEAEFLWITENVDLARKEIKELELGAKNRSMRSGEKVLCVTA